MSEKRSRPKAFMSYCQLDDKYEEGRLTEFRERLEAEIRIQTGKDFTIFQDRVDIKPAENWRDRIKESLDEVLLLIPIITPSFFNSEACRAELEYFLKREKHLKRSDLVLPIYYVDCPVLNDQAQLAKDKPAQAIASHQCADWRELRFEPFSLPQVGRTLAQLAIQIGDALDRTFASKETAAKANLNVERQAQAQEITKSPQGLRSVDVPYAEDQQDIVRAPSPRNEPPTWVVDQTDRGHYRTITEAIKAADPGDRVVVLPGIYEEGIIIDKPLEIIGMGNRDKIVVQATGANTISFKTTLGRVVHLTLRQMGGGENWFGVEIAQGRLELEDCDISSQSSSCVAIQAGADPRIRLNLIHDGKASGVYVFDSGRGTIEDNEICRNMLAGVAIRNGGNPTVRRNRIYDCEREGIILYDNGQGTIEDNSIFGNTFSGVEIRGDSTPLLRHNRIYNGKAGGIYVQKNAQGMLEDNEIFGNALAGVAIQTGANPTLSRNSIHDGKQSGIFINENGQGIIEENDIFGNAYSGLEIKTGGNPTVRRNHINNNHHLALWIGEGGGGIVEDNDLRHNIQGSFYISPDCNSRVERRRNLEK
ncbi:MAG TPA: right-handed parallel beta-helix repeat-containing protein [Pyrinomonadaceae bacterium]|nr:right-handed parallel beta-helix repeat-containing protein [Pyrinomonadaceae bacterium]